MKTFAGTTPSFVIIVITIIIVKITCRECSKATVIFIVEIREIVISNAMIQSLEHVLGDDINDMRKAKDMAVACVKRYFRTFSLI